MKTEIDIQQAGPADAAALTDLGFEYLSWAVDRLREEYAVEWPPIRREDVGDSLEAYASGGVVIIAERSGVAVGMGAPYAASERASWRSSECSCDHQPCCSTR